MNGKSTLRKLGVVILLVMLGLMTCNAIPAKAFNNWHVSSTGDNSNDCQSSYTPCKTIQAAINKASDGDIISVAAGTYSISTNGEVFPINIAKSLVIAGAGPVNTIVDASGASASVVFDAVGSSIGVFISGFTIRGAGTGITFTSYESSHPIWGEISNNYITANVSYGILTLESTVVIKRNLVALNGNGYGGAAIDIRGLNPTIVNNVIGWNNQHGVYNETADTIITNNTISFNLGGTGIANTQSSSPQITNNIVTVNGHYGIFDDGTGSPINTYNDVWGNLWGDYYTTSGGTGSISKNPMFISIFDAHLQCGSPAIDAGNNGAPSVPTFDFDGNPRPVGGVVEMGAYEKQAPYCRLYLPLIIR